MDSTSVDELLERYLTLLDEYTKLRQVLSTLQSDMYHNIARANFSAERGLRYGPDHFDQRMQALRKVHISSADDGKLSVGVDLENAEPSEESVHEAENKPEQEDSTAKTGVPRKLKDPLQWFGILTPMSLRAAQGQAIQAVEQVIPRLAALNVEMAEVEIQVRRARKQRAKEQKKSMAAQRGSVREEVVA